MKRVFSFKPGWFIGVAAVCALLGVSPSAKAASAAQRPNVIFLLTDDQNGDTLGCFGGKVLTPNLDRLAREGVRLDRAYAVGSVCTPSRYTCLTGCYAGRCQSEVFLRQCPPGAPSNVGFNVQITPTTPNLAKALQKAGYATGFVGKWHTGTPPLLKYSPDADIRDPETARILAENQRRMSRYIRDCGFDYAERIYKGNLKDHQLDALDVHNMEWVTEGALEFIEQNQDRPFFLHICPTLQHSPSPAKSIGGNPLVTPAGLLAKAPNVQAPRSSIAPRLKQAGVDPAMAHATWLDDAVGAVLEQLEKLGIADRTAIIVFSDNGTRQGKGTCYEGGAHTPALIYWKSYVTAGATCNRLIGNIDFAPTILDICQAARPEGMNFDGRSFLPLVTGREAPWRDALLLEIGHTRGVCTDRWKYIALRYPPAMKQRIDSGALGREPYHMDTVFDLQAVAAAAHPGYWDADQLYDLQSDPLEKTNLASDPSRAATLAEMKARMKELLAPFPRSFGEFAP